MLFLKIAITILCLWYVSTKIDFSAVSSALERANWLWLAAAFILYSLSKIVSALRLNINFRNIEVHIPADKNIALYWLGMFYNLFLPGSISGDAYKVVILQKKFGTGYKPLASAVILDRFSGLAGLALLLAIYGFFTLREMMLKLLLCSAAVFSCALLFLIIQKWFKAFLKGYLDTLLLGMLVQVIQAGALYSILLSIGVAPGIHAYIFIFLLSSIASVLPLTIGGLGLREIVFLYGASYFGLHQETSVLISLLFFLITVLASLPGLFFVFKEPLNRNPLK